MKYLVFDLEATRRERDEYRQRLDQFGDAGDADDAGGFDPGTDEST
jgi:hypothetical protein